MAKENNAQKPNQKKVATKSLMEKRADKKAKEKSKGKYDQIEFCYLKLLNLQNSRLNRKIPFHMGKHKMV